MKQPYKRKSQRASIQIHNDAETHMSQEASGMAETSLEKGRSSLDLNFFYKCRSQKWSLMILLTLGVLNSSCGKSFHRDNWLQVFTVDITF